MKLCHNKLSISYYERAIKIINEIYEEEYSKLRMAYNHLGKIYGVTGNYQNAKECLEKAIEISAKCHYKDDTETAKVLENM